MNGLTAQYIRDMDHEEAVREEAKAEALRARKVGLAAVKALVTLAGWEGYDWVKALERYGYFLLSNVVAAKAVERHLLGEGSEPWPALPGPEIPAITTTQPTPPPTPGTQNPVYKPAVEQEEEEDDSILGAITQVLDKLGVGDLGGIFKGVAGAGAPPVIPGSYRDVLAADAEPAFDLKPAFDRMGIKVAYDR